jgi:hypothetical protein
MPNWQQIMHYAGVAARICIDNNNLKKVLKVTANPNFAFGSALGVYNAASINQLVDTLVDPHCNRQNIGEKVGTYITLGRTIENGLSRMYAISPSLVLSQIITNLEGKII